MIAGKQTNAGQQSTSTTNDKPAVPPLKKGVSFEEDKKAVFKNFRKGSKGLNIGKNCPFTTFDCQFVDCCDLLTLLKGVLKSW